MKRFSSEPVQALWVFAIPATLLGITWLAMRGLRDLARPSRDHSGWRGSVIQGVFRRPQA